MSENSGLKAGLLSIIMPIAQIMHHTAEHLHSSPNAVTGSSFFFFLILEKAYRNSRARDWIQATAATWATVVAMLDPLTHCIRLGIEPTPPSAATQATAVRLLPHCVMVGIPSILVKIYGHPISRGGIIHSETRAREAINSFKQVCWKQSSSFLH